jgi:hypothetical protein
VLGALVGPAIPLSALLPGVGAALVGSSLAS